MSSPSHRRYECHEYEDRPLKAGPSHRRYECHEYEDRPLKAGPSHRPQANHAHHSHPSPNVVISDVSNSTFKQGHAAISSNQPMQALLCIISPRTGSPPHLPGQLVGRGRAGGPGRRPCGLARPPPGTCARSTCPASRIIQIRNEPHSLQYLPRKLND
jgi:hypothetical protein